MQAYGRTLTRLDQRITGKAEVSMTELTTLVHRLVEDDEAAWEELVSRYGGLLRAIARGFRLSPEEAADAAQTTWLHLLEHVERLRDPERVAGWLSSAMRHECIRLIKNRNREQLTDVDVFDRVEVDHDKLDTDLLRAERDAALWEAVGRLPTRQRQLLRMLALTPTPSYDEVSARLSIAIGAIGPTRGRALVRLRGMLLDAGVTVDSLNLAS